MPDLAGFSDKQLQSIRESTNRINLWEGSVRSGKTIASLFRWLVYVAQSTVRGELVVVSRTRASAARNVFAPLMDPALFGEWAKYVSYTPGAETATVLGRKVWVLGSSDIRSENTLRGLTCAGAYVDEATLLQRDFFTQLLNRLWIGAKLFATTNPDNPAHWLKRDFIDRAINGDLPDWSTWKFFLEDNPALTEERKTQIRRDNVGLFYRRNVLGEWVAGEGAIFDGWDPDGTNGLAHVVPWENLPPMFRLISVGIDYGTQHATVATLLGLGIDRRLYAIDELRLEAGTNQIRFTDAEQAVRLKEWIRSNDHLPEGNWLKPEWIIADQAGASLREELTRNTAGPHGAPLWTQAADKSVEFGIATMASLFGRRKLRVSDRCRSLIREIPGYSWDEKQTAKGKDAPIKVADDAIDSLRYALVTTESAWRPEIESAMVSI